MPAGTHASGQVPKTPRLKNAAPQKVFEAQLPPPARGHPVAPAAARQECTGCPATAKLQVRRPKVWHGAPAACTFRHSTSSGQPVQHVRLSATKARLPDMLCCTRLLGVQHYSQMMDTMLDMALPGAQRTRCGSGPRSTASSAKWPDPERSVLRDKQNPAQGWQACTRPTCSVAACWRSSCRLRHTGAALPASDGSMSLGSDSVAASAVAGATAAAGPGMGASACAARQPPHFTWAQGRGICMTWSAASPAQQQMYAVP